MHRRVPIMRIEWIKPWEVVELFEQIHKLKLAPTSPKLATAGLSGAYGQREKAIRIHVVSLCRKPALESMDRHERLAEFQEFLMKKLELPDVPRRIEDLLWQFTDLLPPGAHLTPGERIDAVARKLMSVAAQCGKTYAPSTIPQINGTVPEELLTWFEQELREGIFREHAERIIRGMRDYGFAPEFPQVPPFVSGTREYTGACAGWWQEVFASYRKFGTEW